MGRELTPQEIRGLADAGQVAEDPGCHLWSHGLTIADAILALRHCFRVRGDARPHSGKPASGLAYRADCHYFRNTTMRIDFNLGQSASGDVILVVTAFVRAGAA